MLSATTQAQYVQPAHLPESRAKFHLPTPRLVWTKLDVPLPGERGSADTHTAQPGPYLLRHHPHLVGAVREVEAGNIHSRFNHFLQLLHRAGGWA